MKKLVLALMLVCFMVGTAFAGIKEFREMANKDGLSKEERLILIAEADGLIADVNISNKDKAFVQLRKGQFILWDANSRREEARIELQKVIDNYPNEIEWCAMAKYYIGDTYRREGDKIKAQLTWCEVCINYPEKYNLWILGKAFDGIKQRVVGDEKYAEVLRTLIKMPNAANSAELLGKVGSQMVKPDLAKYFE